ncbi:YigZ family protein [Mycoplasma phocoenae]|uniref:YigZ family protein n=1 Tax=Mycoplasma phocoenae TaxID=754517 RepID=A0A858U4G4_9MOLU|nr:YigZ family protein [Mycoplasma phocoenae]QJG66969.1 YigZ family protein [Mycoplasma phocoenae]
MFEYEINKSRFIGIIYNVHTEDEVKEIIKKLWSENKRARHICFAYRLISNGVFNEKGDDNGEPKGSAGLPLLNLLQLKKAENVLVVVIRYFGGKLLGRSRLPGAYIKAANGAYNKYLGDK